MTKEQLADLVNKDQAIDRRHLRAVCGKLGMPTQDSIRGTTEQYAAFIIEHGPSATPEQVEAIKKIGLDFSLIEDAFKPAEAKKGAGKRATKVEETKVEEPKAEEPKTEERKSFKVGSRAAVKSEATSAPEGSDVRLDALEKKLDKLLAGVEVINDRVDAANRGQDTLTKLLMFLAYSAEGFTSVEDVPDVREADAGE